MGNANLAGVYPARFSFSSSLIIVPKILSFKECNIKEFLLK